MRSGAILSIGGTIAATCVNFLPNLSRSCPRGELPAISGRRRAKRPSEMQPKRRACHHRSVTCIVWSIARVGQSFLFGSEGVAVTVNPWFPSTATLKI